MMATPLMIGGGIVVLLLLWIIGVFNGLTRAHIRVKEAWSDIEVQLKRRYDLIPNLIETVKGYAKHEDSVFSKVTEARSSALSASGAKEQAEAENILSGALKSLFAVAEDYPDLKASENFQQLQSELVDTEDKIQAARRFYNGSVRDYNIKLKIFPNSLVANMTGFKEVEFFDMDDEQANDPVAVKF